MRCRRVERELAAQEVARVDVAEHESSIRDGRVGAAPGVAGRAGLRARALRADPQQTAAVDPGDAAAAGPDVLHVHRREARDVSGEDAVQPGLARELHLAVPDDADIEARAARSQTTRLSIGAATVLPATGAIAGPELTV